MAKCSRRLEIHKILKESADPISGGKLAEMFNCSRQIVVGDIALLRAEGINIISTNSGYIISKEDSIEPVVLKLKHKSEDTYDVLCTMVDEGVKINSIGIRHAAYGRLDVPVNIETRSDIRSFSERLMESGDKTLGELTGGIHFYTVISKNQLSLIRVQKALNEKGYIVK